MMTRNDYQVEKTVSGVLLNRENVRVAYEPVFREGLCAADPANPTNPRNREWYNKNIIQPMIAAGEIDDGSKTPFDDRKLRYSGSTLDLTTPLSLYESLQLSLYESLQISFGITHFKAFQADQNRNDEENLALQQRGLEEFGDDYAFFSRAPGIAVLPVIQGAVYVGERTNKEASCFLNAVAGHLRFRENPETVDLMEDLYKEMEEEFGIKPESIIGKPVFVGVYSNPIKGYLDFTFIAQTNVPGSYVDSGEWMARVKEREHKPIINL